LAEEVVPGATGLCCWFKFWSRTYWK